MKSLKKTIITVITAIVVALVAYTGLVLYTSDTNVYNNEKEEAVEEISFGDTKRLEEIRKREDVRKQQELIVQEIYLTEKKERVEKEKKETIEHVDLQLAEIEKKLESVRNERLSFQ